MDKQLAVAIICLGMSLLGLLIFTRALTGMRRGEYKYRRAWFHKGADGFGFWLVTGSSAALGIFLFAGSLWFWLTRFILN